ncbi:hypothetical protein P4655_25980 [Priestia megaterium]|uniref:hypothetical protein n=1 Tax=Priestia megaterium TaxID=1404 RepID=UPI0030C9595A
MHPKQICDDFASIGSPLVLDGSNLYIENPENVYPELEEFVRTYKKRIIQYLKGEYLPKDHSIKQTIEKIIHYFLGIEQAMNKKIENWLNHDAEALDMIVNQLFIELWNNGWVEFSNPIANYENYITDTLSSQIFERAMSYFKGG